MDIEKEIEFLEMLESIPLPPDPAPVPTEKDGLVVVPSVTVEYLKKIGVKLDLDKEGRMKTEDYITLLDEYHIPTYGIKIISFKVIGVDDVKKKD